METPERKKCRNCNQPKLLNDFYRRSKARFDPVCIECRKVERKVKYRKEKKNNNENHQVTPIPKNIVENRQASEPQKVPKEKYYKEYKYPDGRVLRLTKEQFNAVCEAIKILENADRRLKGLPLLRG